MILLKIRLSDDTLYFGSTPCKAVDEALEAMSTNAFFRVNAPVVGTKVPIPVRDAQGNIQLVDGRWITPAQAASTPLDSINMTFMNRVVATDNDTLYVRSMQITEISEMTRIEKDDYNKAVQSAAAKNSNLVTAKVPANVTLQG